MVKQVFKMESIKKIKSRTQQFVFLVLCVLGMQNNFAQESVCAIVKIEIAQELTLERQAFEAELVIENVLDDMALENIDINVNFLDENDEPVVATSDPNNTEAKFFIREDKWGQSTFFQINPTWL